MLDYSRKEIILKDIAIIMPNNQIIYYFEIISITVKDIYKDSPCIYLFTKYNTKLKIWYDSGELREKFESDLNYFIKSVLED